MSTRKLPGCLQAALPFVISLCFSSESMAAPAAVDLVTLDPQNARLEWRLPGGIAGTDFPLSLSIYRVSNEARYSIGFSHLGYSEPDPDGKAASLTITLRPNVPMASNPSSLVGGIGFEVLDFQAAELDITLNADPVEEQRLRTSLKLPRPIAQLDASIPYQIKWKGVDGGQLHSWLTKQDGVRWIISGVAKLRFRISIREQINSSCVKAWWERRVNSDPSQEHLLDPAAVAVEILADGCLEADTGLSTSRSVSGQYFERVLSGLQKYISAGSKYSVLTLEKIATAAKPYTFQQDAIGFIRLQADIYPGKFLGANPTYVKDLSGSSIGLGGLLGKK